MDDVVLAYQHRLVGFLRLFTRRVDLAEELAQDVFVMAWEQRRDVYAPEKLRPWLFVMAKRRALREMQRRRHTLEISLSGPDAPDESRPPLEPAVPPDQPAAMLNGQFRAHLEAALRTLRPEEQDLVTLRYFGDLSINELADALDMPMGSVGVKLGRSLERLRGWFESKGLRMNDYL